MKKYILSLLLFTLSHTCFSTQATTNNKSSEIRTKSWVLPLINGYQSKHEDGIYNLYTTTTSGALQLSSMSKRTDITDKEILEIAKSQISGRGELISLNAKNKRGYKSSFTDKGVYWAYWIVVIDRSLILVTYNIDKSSLNINEVNSAKELVDGLSST